MWRGISRAWSVGANEMGEMAVCKLCRKAACGSLRIWLSGSILALGIWEKSCTSVLSATFKL